VVSLVHAEPRRLESGLITSGVRGQLVPRCSSEIDWGVESALLLTGSRIGGGVRPGKGSWGIKSL
jgi:hypothetical protein